MDISVVDQVVSEREESVRLVRESAERFLSGDRQRARTQRFVRPGYSREKWTEMAGMGWLMLRIPEGLDGLGMGLSELCAIARAAGAELTPEPVGMAAIAAPLLPDLERGQAASGATIVLPAFAAFSGPAPLIRDGRLYGRCEAVPMANAADAFLVQAGNRSALIEPRSPGVSLCLEETHDGGAIGVLAFDGTEAQVLDVDMTAARDEATIMLSAQLVGLAETAFDMTVAYLKERKQFGAAIGSFQSLQHRMVDLLLELFLARAAVEAAAEVFDSGASACEIARQTSLAKARATRAAQIITQSAIQMHGGMGYTDEADIGLYLRKVMTLSGLLGSERFHRERALSLLGEQ